MPSRQNTHCRPHGVSSFDAHVAQLHCVFPIRNLVAATLCTSLL